MQLTLKGKEIKPVEHAKQTIKSDNSESFVYLAAYKASHLVEDKENNSLEWVNSININMVDTGDSNFNRSVGEENLLRMQIMIDGSKDMDTFYHYYGKILNVLRDNDIITLKEKIKKINEIFNDKKIESLYVSEKYLREEPKQTIQYKNNNSSKGNYSSKGNQNSSYKGQGSSNSNYNNNNTKAYQILPPYLAIEALGELKYLNVYELGQNGKNEVFYKVTINSPTSKLPRGDDMKISVASRDYHEHSEDLKKLAVVNDVKNYLPKLPKEMGSMAVKFVKAVEQLGAFGEPINTSTKEGKNLQDEKVAQYLEEIAVKIGGLDSYAAGQETKMKNMSSKHIWEKVSRMPSRNPKQMAEFRDFLVNVRGIDGEIVDREFSNGNISSGNIVTTYNKSFGGLFFGMKKIDNLRNGKYNDSVERCFVTESKGRKSITKLHIKATTGLAYGSFNPNAKMTWFSEAVIDNMSLENIFSYSDKHNSKDYNYVSVQGCGNFTIWLKNNFGIGFTTTEKEKKEIGSTVYTYEDTYSRIPMTTEHSEKLKKGLEDFNLHFVTDEKKASNTNLFKLKKLISKIDPEKKINEVTVKFLGAYMDLKQFDQSKETVKYKNKDYVIDNTNIQDFLKANGIEMVYNQDKKDYDIFTVRKTGDVCKPLKSSDKEAITKIRKKLIEKLGTDNLGMCFDNDVTALSYPKGFKEMCETLGVQYSIMIPPFGKNKNIIAEFNVNNNYLNDNNDVLKMYKEIVSYSGKNDGQNFLQVMLSQMESDVVLDGTFKLSLSNAVVTKDIKDELKRLRELEKEKNGKQNGYKKK